MRGLNTVELIGRVGNDPDVHATNDGTIRSRFNIAINRAWNDQDGQRQQATEWVPCVAWGKVGEIVGEYVTKGRLLYVEGRLHTSAWPDETTGEKRSRTEVIVQDVILLDSRRADDQAEADPTDDEAAPAPPRHANTAPAPRRRARVTEAQRAAADADLL